MPIVITSVALLPRIDAVVIGKEKEKYENAVNNDRQVPTIVIRFFFVTLSSSQKINW